VVLVISICKLKQAERQKRAAFSIPKRNIEKRIFGYELQQENTVEKWFASLL
jgi:hypothetical protein